MAQARCDDDSALLGVRTGAEREKKTKAGISWDEETIAEHDKLRGTRMKIEEPDTPYNYEEYDEAGACAPLLP